MMKKAEMIKNLKENNIPIPEKKMSWGNFQRYYRMEMEKVIKLSKPTEQSVNEDIERKIERQLTDAEKLSQLRAKLYPEIVELMKKLKGRTRATHEELREMFRLYNAFYLRNDSVSCGSCVGRVWKTFQKICKGRM